MEKLVAVGSINPIKVAAAKVAFHRVWPETPWVIKGVFIESKVPSQPMSDKDANLGAINRARQALKIPGAEFGVGLESGIQAFRGKYFDSGWAVVISQDNQVGMASSFRMETPPRIVSLIRSGLKLGEVCDLIFNQTNSKQELGYFGQVTNGLLTRRDSYITAIISALARFIQPQIFT